MSSAPSPSPSGCSGRTRSSSSITPTAACSPSTMMRSRPRSRPTPASGPRSRSRPSVTWTPTCASPSPGSRPARSSRTRTPSAASSTRSRPAACGRSRNKERSWYRDRVTAATETNGAETSEPGADATARSARLRHLIITVYGLYARHDGGWLSVATLIRLLADLGIDEPAVRSAISRLKRRGILQARRYGGSAGYQLSAGALAILREGDARIFRRRRATPADGWVLAVFSVPESERHRRHVLRSELTRLGFGMVAPGVWIVPAHPQDSTAETLRRLELDTYADLFRADHLAFGDPAAKIRQWWYLDELERQYESFIRAHEPGARVFEARPPGEQGAFPAYLRAMTDWRRLPYRDPRIPAERLPEGWIG